MRKELFAAITTCATFIGIGVLLGLGF